jgi:Fic family protein
MMNSEVKPLSSQEVADIDARYLPFPKFKDWPQKVSRSDLWNAALKKFKEISADASPEDLARAQEVALRTAAFATGAIEGLYPTDRGLTFTVATQAAAWEQEVIERSADALDLFKAQLQAFELVLDLATRQFPILTQSWIRRIHEVITGPQTTHTVITAVGPQEQALPKGEYKKQPNHVRTRDGDVHAYAPVDMTQPELERLVVETETPQFRDAHPILQASYVHYALAAIHPFADGNGRVARAVASAYTYRIASVPLLVLDHHRDLYLTALAEADEGNPKQFVELMARVTRDAVEMVTEMLKSARAPQPEDVLARFREMYIAQGELSHQQLDALANDLVEITGVMLSEQISELALPDGVDLQVVNGSGARQTPPSGFRSIVNPGPRYVQLDLSAAAPGNASQRAVFEFFVSTASDTAKSVLIRSNINEEELILGLADLSPQLSSAARLRLASYFRRAVGIGLEALLSESRRQLENRGY